MGLIIGQMLVLASNEEEDSAVVKGLEKRKQCRATPFEGDLTV